LGFTSTYILFHWAGYELTTLRIETLSLINQPVEIRRAINISARVTDADVSEFFEDQDGVLLDDDKEEEVVVEVPPAAAEVEVAEAVSTVITAVARRQSTSSGPGFIATSLATSKARTTQNQLVGAIEASNEVNSSAFGTFLQQRQMAEEFEWRQRRLEREEERIH
jgi:glutamate 5-kinase